ncbi:MAG: hypothetical protein ACKVOH_00240 [Chlamydiales bacterium]
MATSATGTRDDVDATADRWPRGGSPRDSQYRATTPSCGCAKAVLGIAIILIPLAAIVVGGMAAGGIKPLTNVFTKNGGIGMAVAGVVSEVVILLLFVVVSRRDRSGETSPLLVFNPQFQPPASLPYPYTAHSVLKAPYRSHPNTRLPVTDSPE